MKKWITVVKVNASTQFVDNDKLSEFYNRLCKQKEIESDPLALPPFLDRRH